MTKKSTKQNEQMRMIALFVLAIVVTIGISAFFLFFGNDDTTITLINDSDCPGAQIELTSPDAPTIRLVAVPGESVEADVLPDVDYEYTLTTFTEEPDDDNRRCYDFDQGNFRAERGSNTDFVVNSQTRSYIIFEIDEACTTATIRLNNPRDEREPIMIEPGESQEVEINPDQDYSYTIEQVDLASNEQPCEEITDGSIRLSLDENTTIRLEPTSAE